jgi:UDP-GlcNAc:undecaprenyl-phosphate GlcNAc-1-phosphate transferase
MPFLLAMIVTTAWLPLFGRLARKWRIVDHPGVRKVHSVPIPRVGGIAMAIGVLIAALLVIPLQGVDRCFLAAAGIVALGGALDDRFDLDYRWKLLAQIAAAGLVVFFGGVQFHALTLDDQLELPRWISIALSMFFIVGITNAINLADGLDGLAGGTTFLSLCALAMLAYVGGEVSSAALSLAFAGAVLGFLRFNTYPASVFMGDAGSQLLGFAVGVLSLRATQTGNSVISSTTPILLLALPILDTLSVMAQRISEGRSPFSADKNHIHHKLLALGLDHHEAVMVIYLIQGDLFLLAYWMRFESDLKILAVVSLFFFVAIGFLQVAIHRGWRLRRAQLAAPSPTSRFISLLRAPEHLPTWSYLIIALSVTCYVSVVLIDTYSLSLDVRWLLLSLLIIAAAWSLLMRRRSLSPVEKGLLYITGAIVVYLDCSKAHTQHWITVGTWIAVLAMAGATAVRLQIAKDRRFEMTPLDLIVLFVALVVPSLPGEFGLPDGTAVGIAKLVVVFYAIEVLVTRAQVQALWMRVAATAMLGVLALRIVV